MIQYFVNPRIGGPIFGGNIKIACKIHDNFRDTNCAAPFVEQLLS